MTKKPWKEAAARARAFKREALVVRWKSELILFKSHRQVPETLAKIFDGLDA